MEVPVITDFAGHNYFFILLFVLPDMTRKREGTFPMTKPTLMQ